MVYIIAPTEAVVEKMDLQAYRGVVGQVEAAVVSRGESIWEGYSGGGLTPEDNEFGIAPLRKNDMANDTGANARSSSYSFNHTVTATGWADLFNYTVPDDMIHGFAGLAIDDPVLRIWQLRVEIGNTRLPILDLQSGHSFDRFSLILKQDQGKELIAGPRQRVLIRGYWGETGSQRVTPLGVSAYRNSNDFLIET